ncbi:lasso peptide isopeptide bond-forming cyclase [Acaryochloris sp. IP29b_bin.137]|uniref:lasso peptide isopeptide bond-forming cyclase n=1 Tax=Acaryochloris sp. IP29b_bin.137 TaxID=2969217 RepID=UPI002606A874|nr:lasso peptide isopeptide bond-forming cyclase [Acaryochloris sp. IP29b_bin.137]
MSAITGIVYLENHPVNPDHLQKMVHTLSHRGPDGIHLWSDRSVGLGHCLLKTTPESTAETLPLQNAAQTLVLTADARIDNRADLIAQLGLKSHPSDVITDSALILAAYERWGEHCPEFLLGDFAFALWDAPQQRLFCARDHFGVKPFFYFASEQLFAFASEIKALFPVPDVPKVLDQSRVADYLTLMLFDPETTFYQQILRLPPAHRMTVTADHLDISSYWSLDPGYELQLDSDQAYADRFREIFTEAVRCRLRSAYPVGTMLSGGIDSSSITCTTAHLKQQRQDPTKLPTFSAVFNEITASDEQDFIQAVVNQYDIDSYSIQGDQISPWTDYQQVMAQQDEPLFASNLHLNRALYQQAKQQSVRVLLDGFDGDVAVSHGIGYLRTLAKRGRWLKLFRETRGFCKSYHHHFPTVYGTYIRKFGLEPLLKKTRVLKVVRKLQTWTAQWQLSSHASVSSASEPWIIPLNKDFTEQLSIHQRYQLLRRQRFGNQPSQRHGHIADVTSGLVSATLEALDRTAANDQLELRYPFWDKRLVEFCVSLPEEQKMQQSWTRMIIRRGMQGVLPTKIQWRRGKGNLGIAFDHTLAKYGADLINQTLHHPPLAITEFVDVEQLNNIVERWTHGQPQPHDSLTLWITVNLALWLQHSQTADDQPPTHKRLI